jgi:hypothetical protein
LIVSQEHNSESFYCQAPLVAALVFLLLRVDLARSLVRTQYLSRRASGQRPDIVERVLSGYLADFYLWGMLSPLIFLLARRFELRKNFPRNVLIHLGASVVLSGFVISAASPLVWYFGYVNTARNPTLAILWRNNAFSAITSTRA